jgi:hypothetical protein
MTDSYEEKIKNICKEIEDLKAKEPTLGYIECTVEICLKHELEFDSLKKVLSKALKEKIELEAIELNLLKYKTNTLF